MKQYREKHRLTQGQMGKKLGYSQAFVSELESGAKKPSHETIQHISDVTAGAVAPGVWFSKPAKVIA